MMNKKNVVLFKPHELQKKIIDEFVATPPLETEDGSNMCEWCIVSVGRQAGKTMLAMNSMIYWMLSNDNVLGAWLTPYNQQGDAVYDELVAEVKPLLQSYNSQSKKIVFKNGSTILFRSLENYEAVRGYTFHYAVVDECAFVREEAWKIFRPTMAVKGRKCLVTSTPWVKNTFYDMYRLGLNEDNKQFRSYKAPSTSNPFFPHSELESARAILTEDIIRQEYFADFAEAGGGVFTGFEKQCKLDEYHGEEKSKRCYLGVDIALGGKDWTVAVIMDDEGTVINVERWKDSITSRQISRLQVLVDSYNIAGGFIEMNQERGIAQSLHKYHKSIKSWETKRNNKPQLIQDLKKDIEDGVISLPTQRLDPVMIKELGDFTKEAKNNGYIAYGHPPGGNDDTVIALALANQARRPDRYNKWTPSTGARFKR